MLEEALAEETTAIIMVMTAKGDVRTFISW
jgi:hypothetical protein